MQAYIHRFKSADNVTTMCAKSVPEEQWFIDDNHLPGPETG